ncbi:hypothetical protein SALBM217S_06993 [Streptomyces griseoloalbus]
MIRGDLDLAVVLDWYNKPMPLPDGLVKALLLDDPADVALPAGHPLAGREEIDLAELAEDEWITWGEGEFCHEWLMFTLRAAALSCGWWPNFTLPRIAATSAPSARRRAPAAGTAASTPRRPAWSGTPAPSAR